MKDSLDEKKIVTAIIAKDEQALLTFYKEYKDPVFRYISKQLNDKSLAEEITQDVFLDFIEALRDFHFQASLKTFLFSIARNKVIDVIRRKKVKKILFSSLPNNVVENITSVVFDDALEKKELAEKMKNVLEALPNDYQLVLRLKYVEGKRVKSIAEKLSLKFKATESLIYRARKMFVKVFQSLP